MFMFLSPSSHTHTHTHTHTQHAHPHQNPTDFVQPIYKNLEYLNYMTVQTQGPLLQNVEDILATTPRNTNSTDAWPNTVFFLHFDITEF